MPIIEPLLLSGSYQEREESRKLRSEKSNSAQFQRIWQGEPSTVYWNHFVLNNIKGMQSISKGMAGELYLGSLFLDSAVSRVR